MLQGHNKRTVLRKSPQGCIYSGLGCLWGGLQASRERILMPEHKEKFSIGYIYLGFAAGVAFTILFFVFTGGQSRPSPVTGAASPPAAPLSILEAEQQFDFELFVPTVREIQQLANRHGANLKVDNTWGDKTEAGIDKARCQQEASRYDYFYKKDKK